MGAVQEESGPAARLAAQNPAKVEAYLTGPARFGDLALFPRMVADQERTERP
jgi:hypothetical protein